MVFIPLVIVKVEVYDPGFSHLKKLSYLNFHLLAPFWSFQLHFMIFIS